MIRRTIVTFVLGVKNIRTINHLLIEKQTIQKLISLKIMKIILQPTQLLLKQERHSQEFKVFSKNKKSPILKKMKNR